MKAQVSLRPSELYGKIWKEDPSYGTKPSDVADTVDHRIVPHLRRVFPDQPPTTVADFGAGDGRFLALMKERGLLIAGVGVDVVQPETLPEWLTWHRQEMWQPVRFARADYVISTDALEHLQPDTVRGALMQIKQAAPHGFLRIALQEDKYGTDRGLHLHPSVFPAGEWMRLLGVVGINPSSVRVYYGARMKEQALEVWF